ncbi:major facilitator superfamily domain-containing protein [Pilobolus umbonatus]|nr:major facilitator superfamily domain-containing protein [Pilobolus umbonatus]
MYLICKLLYISIFALLSAAPPYLPLYYHDILGFSSNQIGVVLAIAPFIQSIACPLWSYVVDKRPQSHGLIMAITSLLGGIAVMCIMGLGHLISTETTPIYFGWELSNTVVITLTSILALTFAFFTLPNMALVDSAVMKILGPNKLLYGEQRLWGSVSAGLTILIVGQLLSFTGNLDVLFWVFACATVLFIVFAFIANITDDSTQYYTPITDAEEEHRYASLANIATNGSEKLLGGPSQRAFNTYNSLSGEYNSKNMPGQSHVSLFKPDSVTSAYTIREEADETLDVVGINLGLAISRIASMDQSIISFIDRNSEEIPSMDDFKSFRVLSFLLTTLLFGFVLSIIVNFLFLFLSQDLHMPTSWIGWTGPTTGVTELLCFCFSKQLTEKFGVTKMIVIAHIATIIRCLVYTVLVPDSFITNVSALLLQTLHGIGFGIFWATAVSEMDSFFPPEQRSVAQGVLGALHFGLGTGLGALTGGYLYEYMGPIWMFRIAAIVATINMTIFTLGRIERK